MADTLYTLEMFFVLTFANCCISSMAICFEDRTARSVHMQAERVSLSRLLWRQVWEVLLRSGNATPEVYVNFKFGMWDVMLEITMRLHAVNVPFMVTRECLLKRRFCYRAARAGMRSCRSRVILGERLSLGHHARHCKLLSHLAHDWKPVYFQALGGWKVVTVHCSAWTSSSETCVDWHDKSATVMLHDLRL